MPKITQDEKNTIKSKSEYEFKTTIDENHLNAAGITHGEQILFTSILLKKIFWEYLVWCMRVTLMITG